MKDLFVYILTNDRRTALYIGVTNNLERRLWQHQNGEGSKFGHRYNLHRLIYFEVYPDPRSGIARETQLKGWTRAKKEALIAAMNPEWRDLAGQTFGAESLTARRDCPAPTLGCLASLGSSTPLHSAQNDSVRDAGRKHAC